MPVSSRVDPRAKVLKDLFATLNRYPRRAAEFPLARPEILKSLAASASLPAHALDGAPDEQIRRVVQGICLQLFVPELIRPERDSNLLLGLLFFWHSHLAPITPAHAVTPLSQVIAHCSRAENLREFVREVHGWVREAYAGEPQPQRTLLALLSPETFGKILLGGLSSRPSDSERRTFGNHVNLAARTIALRVEQVAPVASETQPKQTNEPAKAREAVNAQAPVPVGPAARPILRRLADFTWAENLELAVTNTTKMWTCRYVPRVLDTTSLRGSAVTLGLWTDASLPLPRMSGFLAGVLGSGRTAFLKYLVWNYADRWRSWGEGPLAFYFSASEFYLYGRNRRSIQEFIVDRICPPGDQPPPAEWLDTLKNLDRAGKLLLLVDDLGRLPEAEQVEVMAQLAFSPAVVFAVLPWQVKRLNDLVPRPTMGRTELGPLSPDEQRHIAESLLHDEPYPDVRQGAEARLQELPHLASSPLGLVSMLMWAWQNWSATYFVQRALEEFVRRAGLPLVPSRWQWNVVPREWYHLGQASKDLLSMLGRSMLWPDWSGQCEVVVTRGQVENPRGDAWQMDWEAVKCTGLFEPVEHPRGEGLALINRDLAAYLVGWAASSTRSAVEVPAAYPAETRAFLEIARRHWLNLSGAERPRPMSRARVEAELAARRAVRNQLRSQFPELFRKLS